MYKKIRSCTDNINFRIIIVHQSEHLADLSGTFRERDYQNTQNYHCFGNDVGFDVDCFKHNSWKYQYGDFCAYNNFTAVEHAPLPSVASVKDRELACVPTLRVRLVRSDLKRSYSKLNSYESKTII